MTDTSDSSSDAPTASISHPPNLLKEKTGRAPGALDDVLAHAETLVAKLQSEFETRTEMHISALASSFDARWNLGVTRALAIREFRRLAHDIKGEAGTFGYPLLTLVAGLFGDYLRDTPPGFEKTEAVRNYIEAFQVIWAKRIQGEGGDIGRQLIATLTELNERTRRQERLMSRHG